MSYNPPEGPHGERSTGADQPDYTVEGPEDHELLGIVSDDEAAVHDPETGQIFRGNLDKETERVTPRDRANWSLDAEESLAEFLERVGEETGWDSLTEYARDHLDVD